MNLRHVLVNLVVALSLAGCGSSPTPTPKPSAAGKQVPTVAFLYQAIPDSGSLRPLGRVDMIVTTRQGREARAARAIHAHGAKAYRYVQTFWFPEGQAYDGLDMAEHRDMAFCAAGNEPAVGREAGGHRWFFIDANEQAVQRWFVDVLKRLKRAGYDGIMFDRGLAALTGTDPASHAIWNKVSSCTEKPVKEGATFADAYVGLMKLVRANGLKLFQNYGHSPFDAAVRFRPNPADPGCAVSIARPTCGRTADGMRYADYFLDEAVAHPKDKLWARDFANNGSNEHDKAFGGSVVGLITQGTLEGSESRQDVVYQYARVRLFDMPVAIFTGYDRCRGHTEFCNRLGTFPELTSARWGTPVASAPRAATCVDGSTVNCLWTRQYARGLVAVNASDHPLAATVKLAKKTCAPLVDLESKERLSAKCRTSLRLRVPAWSGVLLHAA